ncbi:MAG: AAA family ATPase [bacterium]|nr:AAA family ATPase [bacterium]
MKYKRIPYGISNYEKLVEEGYYFVDKTAYIEQLEELGSPYLFFLRPRRFGKSLLISILSHYYDINKKDQFDSLFKDTYIGKNPTPLKNSYPVLEFDFSMVNTNGALEEIEFSFVDHVRGQVENFLEMYRDLIENSEKILTDVSNARSAGDKLKNLVGGLALRKMKYYLLIDEYDNFANTILIEHGEDTYKKVTHSGGFLRNFFTIVKGGTKSGAIDRLFVTGVSPLVLADVTSGFNIGDNISTGIRFNSMVGFTREETEVIVDYYIEKDLIKRDDKKKTIGIMNEFYNNYSFSEKVSEKVYNTDMILYYVNKYIQEKKIPSNLIDDNVRTDYGRLKYLLVMDNKLNGNFSILKEILDKQSIEADLKSSFAIGEIIDREKFVSLLFYLGLITIDKHLFDSTFLFKPINRVIETMFWGYMRKAVDDVYDLKIDIYELKKLFNYMAFEGKWEELFRYVIDKFYEACSIRDFTFHEEGMKLFLLAYLNLTPLYRVHSEPEMNKGYADIWLEKNHFVTDLTKFSYMIELKYIKADELKQDAAVVDTAFEKAREKLEQYVKDKKISGSKDCALKKIIVVMSSGKLERMECVNEY